MYRGLYSSAIVELAKHAEMAWAWDTERSLSQVFVGDCLKELGRDPVPAYTRALEIDSRHRAPMLRLAWHYFRKGNAQLTACYAVAAMEIPPLGFYYEDVSDFRETPHLLCYWASWELGRYQESKTHYDKAAEYAPSNPAVVRDRQFYYPDSGAVSVM
jgi:tetratricopeptide (TPR) repeat protein